MLYLNSSPHCSPLALSPPIPGIVSTVSFCIYIHVYTVFAPYSPSAPCLLSRLSTTWAILPALEVSF
jgi:hypothetical protein